MFKKLLSFFEEDVDSELKENDLLLASARPLLPQIEQPILSNEKKDYEGIVTGIYDTYGLIDNEIYFTLENVVELRMPVVGDRVHVLAERGQKGSGGWRATCVYLISNENEWDNPNYDPNKEASSVSTAYNPDDSAKIQQLKEREEFLKQNRILQDNFSQTLTELLVDKGNISITESIDFGKVELGDSVSAQLHIQNEHTATRTLYGMCIQAADRFSECQFELSGVRLTSVSVSEVSRKAQESLPLVLDPELSATVTVYCHAKKLGRERLLVVFEFDDFYIGRTLSVNVHDSKYSVDTALPFQRKISSQSGGVSTWREDGDVWIIPGQRPSRSSAGLRQSYRMSQYSLPDSVRACMMNGRNIGAILPCLNQNLSADNYKARFSALLHLEEVQQELEMSEFDMHSVCLRPMGEYLSITVQGLVEGRPSLLVGDKVYVSKTGDYSARSPIYEGFIHEVQRSEILIKFCEDFHIQYNFEGYNVKFAFNRSTLRRCHAAVESVSKHHLNVIFAERIVLKPSQILPIRKIISNTAVVPYPIHSPSSKYDHKDSRISSKNDHKDSHVNSMTEKALIKPVKVSQSVGIKRCPSQPSKSARSQALYCTKYYNNDLNVIQKRAVQRILQGEARPLPYIIFGPPGTGKTVTVVETILQIFHKVPNSRILVCAPSNSAVDLLTEKLHQSGLLGLADMRRLVAYHRGDEGTPADVKPYCLDGENEKVIRRVRIMLSTCSSAAVIGQIFNSIPPRIARHGFTHVFIDEVCQATEPECMIPISLLSTDLSNQIILAGDPKQLGAVLRSDAAKYFGLDVSFVERLMELPLYQINKTKICNHSHYDSRLVTKLRHNYRSHPALLSLTSHLFYADELIASASTDITDCLSSLPFLSNNSFPLLFHGIRGDALREGNSPSWFNPQEVMQVVKYLQTIIYNDSYKLSYDDVGIITPYRKQVEKIRLLMEKFEMPKVKVGSVEEFQGQERLAIILSTVRSTEAVSDIESCIEFLANPKRFNVSITRAHALLIVIGNPHVLVQDMYWHKLLKYCVENKAYVGCDLPDLNLEI